MSLYTLNLAYPERGNVEYKVSKFPDGQQQVSLDLKSFKIIQREDIAEITARLTSFADLELILATTASLRELGFEIIWLVVSYFTGARSDRLFQKGSNNYLKSVICPIINAQNYERVSVFDPHSDVLEGCLNRFRKIDNIYFVNQILRELNLNINNVTLVCPDSGYLKKMYAIVESLGYTGDVIICSKYRRIDGSLTNIQVPLEESLNKPLLILDDICDGGRTFIELAKIIREKYPNFNKEIYLGISHGIFSSGFNELSVTFDQIFCTNSFKTIDFEAANYYDQPAKRVTQFNIFNGYTVSSHDRVVKKTDRQKTVKGVY